MSVFSSYVPSAPIAPAGLTTRILHDARQHFEHGAVHAPIHPSIAFGYDRAEDLVAVFQGEKPGYRYSRQGNPTATALEQKITQLEQGVGSVSFATGMAAVAAVFQAFLQKGDHVIASQFLFGNTHSQFLTLQKQGVELSFVDPTDVAAVAAAWRPETRFVFVETIANPRTQIPDLSAIGALCQKNGTLLIVDNTLTSPALFVPKNVGAAFSINSLTKYLSGHGAILGGVVTDTGAFDWREWPHWVSRFAPSMTKAPIQTWGTAQIRAKSLRDFGATLSASAAHQILLGMETLELRLIRITANAAALAAALAKDSRVAAVYHPSIVTHPQHQRAAALFAQAPSISNDVLPYGGLLSFELRDHKPLTYLNRLTLPIISTHLGDTRTLVIPVAQTIYHEMGAAERAKMGIAEGLIRVSVGIENSQDLTADFMAALDAK